MRVFEPDQAVGVLAAVAVRMVVVQVADELLAVSEPGEFPIVGFGLA